MDEPSPELIALVIAARRVCEYGPDERYREALRKAGKTFYETQPGEFQRRFNGLEPLPYAGGVRADGGRSEPAQTDYSQLVPGDMRQVDGKWYRRLETGKWGAAAEAEPFP